MASWGFLFGELKFWCQDTSKVTRALPTCVTVQGLVYEYGSSNTNRILSSKPTEFWLHVLGLDEACSTWRQPWGCPSWTLHNSFSQTPTHHLHSYRWPRIPRYRVPRIRHTNSHSGSPCCWGGQAGELLCAAHMHTFTKSTCHWKVSEHLSREKRNNVNLFQGFSITPNGLI